jgi:hypothetical protein
VAMGFKQSVKEWCVSNGRQDILDRWDYILNNVHPEDISVQSKMCFYLKCTNGIHDSSKFQICTLPKHNSTLECKYCLSFGYWCITNNRNDLLNRWDYELNKCSPMEVTKSSPRVYYFKCPRGIHESSSYKLSNLTKYTYGAAQCRLCNSFAQWGIDNIDEHFLELYWDYEKNIGVDPWKIAFRARPTTVIYIKCQYDESHGSYKTFPDHFVEGARCPQCSTTKTESYFQESVRQYIESSYDYTLTHEYKCSIIAYNNVSKHYMPFDNDVDLGQNKHLIIETHGKQHYEITQYTRLYAKRSNISVQEAFDLQRERDRMKKEYVLSLSGYYYLELSYQSILDNSYKYLIDTKIQEILLSTKQL